MQFFVKKICKSKNRYANGKKNKAGIVTKNDDTFTAGHGFYLRCISHPFRLNGEGVNGGQCPGMGGGCLLSSPGLDKF